MRFQPTASLAALASRRLKRGPLGYLLRSHYWVYFFTRLVS
jgi:hypothetical protein